MKNKYYCSGNIEAIDIIDYYGMNFSVGCAVKYILRAGKKDGESFTKDITKTIDYLEHEIEIRNKASLLSKFYYNNLIYLFKNNKEYDKYKIADSYKLEGHLKNAFIYLVGRNQDLKTVVTELKKLI